MLLFHILVLKLNPALTDPQRQAARRAASPLSLIFLSFVFWMILLLALLLPFYVAEALARALVEPGRHAIVAATTCAVAMATFAALLGWFRGESLRHRKDGPLDDA